MAKCHFRPIFKKQIGPSQRCGLTFLFNELSGLSSIKTHVFFYCTLQKAEWTIYRSRVDQDNNNILKSGLSDFCKEISGLTVCN